MDYESAESTMGKPSGVDLQLGFATGLVLFVNIRNSAHSSSESSDNFWVWNLFVNFVSGDLREHSTYIRIFRLGIVFDVPQA